MFNYDKTLNNGFPFKEKYIEIMTKLIKKCPFINLRLLANHTAKIVEYLYLRSIRKNNV